MSKRRYIKEFSDSPQTMKIGEHMVPLPVMPDESEMENFGLPVLEQKYQRMTYPSNLREMSDKKKDEIIGDIFHVLKNGRWHLIKGQPVYVTGAHELFCSFWVEDKGQRPDFRWESVEFFNLLDWVQADPNSYGVIDIKPRRIGDTGKTLCYCYWFITRFRDSRFGQQNKVGDDAEKNFKRLIEANIKMPFFLRPVNRGSDKPSEALELTYPEEMVTMKKLREGNMVDKYGGTPPLNSRADWRSSVEDAYDGERLDWYYGDEIGKWIQMNPLNAWSVIARCLSMNNGKTIIGKAIFTSTVEEIENNETVENITKMWNDADPNNKNANNRTLNGLTRIFRGAELNTTVDEWGFHIQEELEYLDNDIAALKKAGDIDRIIQLKRQFPRSIEEALAVPAQDCVLLPLRLDRQIEYLTNGTKENGQPVVVEEVKGDLVWKNSFGGAVEWVPNTQGRWKISQSPEIPNDHYIQNKRWFPRNSFYSIGVDPIEYRTNETQIKRSQGKQRASDGAIVVYRVFNPMIDNSGSLDVDEDTGEIISINKMKTDKFVCTYCNRPDNPYVFFEDVLKTCIYYGSRAFIESDKTYVINKFYDKGYQQYLKLRTRETTTNPLKAKKSIEAGAKATPHLITLYVDALKTWVRSRIENCHHIGLIKDMRKFKVTNRTYCDLTVAAGFALLGAMDVNLKDRIDADKNAWKNILPSRTKAIT